MFKEYSKYDGLTGLTVATQVVGRFGDAKTVMRLTATCEQALPWIDRHRPLWMGHWS